MIILALSVLAAALFIMIGAMIYVKINDHFPDAITTVTGVSAGFLIVLILYAIIPEAAASLESMPLWVMPLCVAVGAFFIIVFEKCLPVQHHHEIDEAEVHTHKKEHIFLVTLIAFGIHSLFEMISIFITGASDLTTGLILALVIAVHNIPIGFIIMAQLELSGEPKKKIIRGMIVLALCEFAVAGLIFLLLANFITPALQGMLLAATGGVMLYLLFDELLPKIYQDVDQHKANYAILIGAVAMLLFLTLIGE